MDLSYTYTHQESPSSISKLFLVYNNTAVEVQSLKLSYNKPTNFLAITTPCPSY